MKEPPGHDRVGDPVAQERGHIACIALDKTDTLAGVGPGFRPPQDGTVGGEPWARRRIRCRIRDR